MAGRDGDSASCRGYVDLRRPFGVTTSLGDETELEKSLRLNFLAFCWRVPELAERYLRSVVARRPGDHIADEIMKFRGTAARAAPAALADLTLRTLIPVRKRNEFQPGTLDHGPFDIGDISYFPPSPNQGPFLDLLTNSIEHGMRVVRGLIDHAVAFYSGNRDPGNNSIVVRFPDGDRTFAWQNCYNWSRSSHSAIATSVLMALEASGHKRLEDGVPLRQSSLTSSELRSLFRPPIYSWPSIFSSRTGPRPPPPLFRS